MYIFYVKRILICRYKWKKKLIWYRLANEILKDHSSNWIIFLKKFLLLLLLLRLIYLLTKWTIKQTNKHACTQVLQSIRYFSDYITESEKVFYFVKCARIQKPISFAYRVSRYARITQKCFWFFLLLRAWRKRNVINQNYGLLIHGYAMIQCIYPMKDRQNCHSIIWNLYRSSYPSKWLCIVYTVLCTWKKNQFMYVGMITFSLFQSTYKCALAIKWMNKYKAMESNAIQTKEIKQKNTKNCPCLIESV